MTVSEYLSATAEKILPGGETLVRVEGESVLVPNAVPGDALKLTLSGKRRGIQRGATIEVVQPSGQRVQAPCPVADACGGCALQFITAEHQASVKSGWVDDAFKSMIDTRTELTPVHANSKHFRRRLRWFVGHDDQGYFLGFYALASHRPVRHVDCMALTPELNTLRQIIEHSVNLEAIGSIQVVQLDDGIHVVLEADVRPDGIEIEYDILPLQWWWRDERHITRPLKKSVQSFHDVLPAGKTGIALTVGPDDFVQGQAEGNRALIAQIQAWAGDVMRIADLFCGIGNLSLPLAAATGAHVYGAELNAASVRAASKNAKALGLSASFEEANLFESFDLEAYIGADVLILDPPRRGAKRVCKLMPRLLPKKIIMISCDAAAGARDGLLLQAQGYRLRALRALDLFPGAGHVETMSLWEPD